MTLDQQFSDISDHHMIVNLALDHVEGEGDWCLPTECHVGED